MLSRLITLIIMTTNVIAYIFKSCRMFREGGGSPYSDHDGDGGGWGDKRIYVHYLYFKFKFKSVLDKHTSAKLCHGFSHEFFQTFLIVSKTKRFFF